MPKLTPQRRAELEAELAADDDDDDDEVEVGFADGSRVRGSYRRVKKVAAARGYKLEADPDDGKDKDDGKDDKSSGTRFAGRRVS